MAAVVFLAIVTRSAVVAFQVSNQPNGQTLSHLRLHRDKGDPFVYNHGTTASSYWAEFWRRALGLEWPGNFTCPCKQKDEAETGRPSIDVETSHDMDALDRRMDSL